MRHAPVPMDNHAKLMLLTSVKQADKGAKDLKSILQRRKCTMATTSRPLCSMPQKLVKAFVWKI